MKRQLKGQFSLEFLTTYGWAFLVILVTAGALAYFGVFSPGQYVPEDCQITPELQCIDYTIRGADHSVVFRVLNNYEREIDLLNVTVSNYPLGDADCSPTSGLPRTMTAGAVHEIVCTYGAEGQFTDGSKIEFKIEANFKRTGGTRAYTVRGRLYTAVV